MAFVPWKDRVTETPHRYKLTEVSADTYDLEAVPGAIGEAGTPVNAENLNKLLQRDGDDIKDTVTTFTEADTRENIATGEKTSTIFGKIKKWFADLKPHAFTTPSATQSTSADTVPSSKLLKESSFARVFKSLTEINSVFTGDTAIPTVYDAMPNNSIAIFSIGTISGAYPEQEGTCEICKVDDFRGYLRYTKKIWNNTTNVNMYFGTLLGTSGGASRWSGWKQVINDADAQTITGVKTYSVSPIVPTTPSGPSAAVSKSYADSVGFARVYRSLASLPTYDNNATFVDFVKTIFAGAAVPDAGVVAIRVYSTDLPNAKPISDISGTMFFYRVISDAIYAKFITSSRSTTNKQSIIYETYIARDDNAALWCGWKRVINDEDAQTITGVKTYTASPIVPTTPSGPSAAVAKSYVDGQFPEGFIGNDVLGDVGKYFKWGTLTFNTSGTIDYHATILVKEGVAGPLNSRKGGIFNLFFRCVDGTVSTTNANLTFIAKESELSESDFIANISGNIVTFYVKKVTQYGRYHFKLLQGAIRTGKSSILEIIETNAVPETSAPSATITATSIVADNISAQTITGIKTFATGATPLITDAPTTDLMAVNKAYVDGIVSATNISYFTTKEQVKEVVPNWVYKQSGSTLAWNFNTLLNNIRLAGHPRSVVCIYFDGVNAYLGNYKDKECYLTAFITEEPLNRRVEIFFPKTANTLARKDLYIGNDNDVYHDFIYQESIFIPELYYTRGDIGITTLPSGVYELRLDAISSSDSYYFIIAVNSNTTTFGTQSGVGLYGPKINCLSFKGKINFYVDNGADLEEEKASGYFHYRKIKDLYGSNQSGKIVNWIPVT